MRAWPEILKICCTVMIYKSSLLISVRHRRYFCSLLQQFVIKIMKGRLWSVLPKYRLAVKRSHSRVLS